MLSPPGGIVIYKNQYFHANSWLISRLFVFGDGKIVAGMIRRVCHI
jgi:hypothetical protein